MICRKCGCSLERTAVLCDYCGEVIQDAAADGQAAAPSGSAEGLVALRPLSPVPGSHEETMRELKRLQTYFDETTNKYDALQDLLLKQKRQQHPSLFRWLIGGGLVAALFYFLLGVHLPHGFLSLTFILWGAVTALGYMQSGKRHERRTVQLKSEISQLENDIRMHFNRAEHCFLPLDYTEPKTLKHLMESLDAGMAESFEAYRLEKSAQMEPRAEASPV